MGSIDNRINILLVGDDPKNVGTIRDALEASGSRCRLHTVGTGSSMVKYLHREEPYVDAPKPHVILFDFSTADERYLNTLDRIKSDQALGDLPIAVLTVPDSERMLEQRHGSGDEECVMFSPIGLVEFFRSMKSFRIDRFVNSVKLIAKLGFVLVRMPEPVRKVSTARTAMRLRRHRGSVSHSAK